MSDEARGHSVEDLLEQEAARRSHGNDRLPIIRAALAGQRLKRGPLGLDALGVPGVLAARP